MTNFEYTDAHKMEVIININGMRGIIWLNPLNVKAQLKLSYDELHEYQNTLIEHYNQSLTNAKNQ